VPDSVELHLFTSGTLVFAGFEVPVPFFLIRHPDGNVVVDGGNPLAVARDPRAHLGPLADVFEVHMTAEDHCLAQLERIGADPAAITHVVQTHLHMVSLQQTGAVLLTADAADNRAQWHGRMEPRALTSLQDALNSIELLRRIAAEHDALVVHGHDPKNWAAVSEPSSYR